MRNLKEVVRGHKDLNKTDRLTIPGLALLSSPYHWKKHLPDIKIYLESCVALNDSIVDTLLVTDDQKFFNFFLQSQVIFELFQKCITLELGVNCIPVKLAGEVIPGM